MQVTRWGMGRPGAFVVRWLAQNCGLKAPSRRFAAVAGAGALGRQVAETIISEPRLGLDMLGFYDDPGDARECAASDLPGEIRGTLEDLVGEARKGRVEVIYVALPIQADARIKELVRRLSTTAASVYFVPDLVAFRTLHPSWCTLGATPVVSLFERPLSRFQRVLKRIEDAVVAVLVLGIFGIPMLLISLGVRLTSRGPAIFRQTRHGLDGREIVVWKYRTMTACEDGADFRQACRGDPRITRFGAYLRASSLDELPQLAQKCVLL